MTVASSEHISEDFHSKAALDRKECDNLVQLCARVKHECDLCFKATEFSSSPNYYRGCAVARHLHNHLSEVYHLLNDPGFVDKIKYIYSFVGLYDFRQLRANGFRTLLSIFSCCLTKILSHLRNLDRRNFSMWPKTTEESLLAYLQCLEELSFCVLLVCEFPKYSGTTNTLFPELHHANLTIAPTPSHDNLGPPLRVKNLVRNTSRPISPESAVLPPNRYNDLVDYFDLINQDVFYGRAIAFYLDSSAQNFFGMLCSIMAGFADSYQGSMVGIPAFVNAVFRSVTSYLSPEDRGVRIAQITRSADVFFCKRFWSLAENRFLVEMPKLLMPQMAVSHNFVLPNEPVTLETEQEGEGSSSTVTIQPPSGETGITVRLLSKVRRRGMAWVLSQPQPGKKTRETSPLKGKSLPPRSPDVETEASPYLLIHIHGGGFIALSSETHDVYLRAWAEKLECPVLSLNYSLAPEAPYPRALDECVHAVSWALAHRSKLGARPDARVVVCGDSAGGNLTLGVCLRAAALGLRDRPVGALVAYAPAALAYLPSPSRMLSICDPLLPIGVISRCIIAYSGIDESSIERNFSSPATFMAPRDGQDPELDNAAVADAAIATQSIRHSSTVPLWSRLWPPTWFPGSSASTASSPPPPPPPTSAPGETVSEVDSPPVCPATPFGDRMRVISRHLTAPVGLNEMGTEGGAIFDLSGGSSSSSPSKPSSRKISAEFQDASSVLAANDDSGFASRLQEAVRAERLKAKATEGPPRRRIDVDAKLQRIRRCPIPQDPFLSPYLASDELFGKLPPLGIISCEYDPFLDDTLELAKRAEATGVPVEVMLAAGMPHAFLNFAFLNTDYRRATMRCADLIARLLRGEIPSSPPPPPSLPPPPPPSPLPQSCSAPPTV